MLIFVDQYLHLYAGCYSGISVKWNPCKQIIIEIIKMFIYLAQQGVVNLVRAF